MLKPTTNPFDILKQLPTQFGTNPTPNWCLIWNKTLALWSAFNYDEVDDLLDVALDANWDAICLLQPQALQHILDHPRPDIVSQELHKYATHFRLTARHLTISDFAPDHIPVDDDPPPAIIS